MLVQLNRTDQNRAFAPNSTALPAPDLNRRRAEQVVVVLGHPGRVAALGAHLPTGWAVRFAPGAGHARPGKIVAAGDARPREIAAAGDVRPEEIAGAGDARPEEIAGVGDARPGGIAAAGDVRPGEIVLISGARVADVEEARAVLSRRTRVVALVDEDAPAELVAEVLSAGADVCVRGGQPAILASHLVACRRRQLTERWVNLESALPPS